MRNFNIKKVVHLTVTFYSVFVVFLILVSLYSTYTKLLKMIVGVLTTRLATSFSRWNPM